MIGQADGVGSARRQGRARGKRRAGAWPAPLGRRAAPLLVALAAAAAAPGHARADDDPLLTAARRYVEQSDRYLHHDKLRRGMKGYGLTVLAGTKIVRFDVRIVSVVPGWYPHQAVILAMLSGQDLETSGVISGMSGSPIFVRHDGKDKLIGALAYAWRGQKRPLCGVQPITQMLALGGLLGHLPGGKAKAKAQAGGGQHAEFLRAVLDPRKRDFSCFGWPERLLPKQTQPAGDGAPRLVPLTTPLMVRGVSRRTFEALTKALAPAGMVPVQAGGAAKAQQDAARAAKVAPGAALSVALVTGDADFAAVGTVTDVVGSRVLAFGHSMFAEGEISVPIGPAYVHTVVAGLFNSFKLSSTAGVSGTLDLDEETGVFGRIGPKPDMIPMTVAVRWPGRQRQRTYRYRVARHRWMTPRLITMLIMDSAWAWRELPEHHTVRHTVEVDFDKLGRYRASNVSTDMDVYDASSDTSRPISALRNNPYGPAPQIKRVNVSMVIEETNRLARIRDFRLDGAAYRPGETVCGEVTVQPYRQPRTKLRVAMQLPANLPEGTYTLTVCDDLRAVSALQREQPHRFAAKTVAELFDALRRTVDTDAGRLYLRLPLPRGGGLAVEKKELADLPDSRARILAEAEALDARRFSAVQVGSVRAKYVIRGSAKASFRVTKQPKETLTRERTR